MQANTERRTLGLKDKIPDIQKTLDTVRFLKSRKVGSILWLSLSPPMDIDGTPRKMPSP